MSNITLPVFNNLFSKTFTISNQYNNQLILNTENTFVDKDIELNFNVQSGQVVTPATTITAVPTIYNSVTASGYIVKSVGSINIKPSVTTNGYVTNSQAAAGTVTVTGEVSIPQSILSTSTITSQPTTEQTITIGAGYYPNDRTITINPMSSGTKANISSNGTVTTTPTVTISGTCTMAISAGSTPYYFTRTGSVSNGIVQTKYSNTTAGYANAFSTTNGSTVTVTPTKTADTTVYIPAVTITPSFSGGGVSFTNNSNNIELVSSDTDNNNVKISLRATRAATSLTNTITAGYIPATAIAASYASTYVDGDYYVKGITLAKPINGTATFYLTFPNGDDDTITFHFEIDTSGNVTIS